jgi:hypothetical protein
MTDVTAFLNCARGNNPGAIDELFALLNDDLGRIARLRLAASGHHTLLNTRVLLHEAYLHFPQAARTALNDREHFLAYAASFLRSIVVDFARRRRRHAKRRAAGPQQVTLGPICGLLEFTSMPWH